MAQSDRYMTEEGKIMIVVLLLLVVGIFLLTILINNTIDKETMIKFKCCDGRRGIVTLEEWSRIKIPYDCCIGEYGYGNEFFGLRIWRGKK